MRGFWATLTEKQKKAALEYRGPENLGPVTTKETELKFQAGDSVRLATILPENDQYLVALNKRAAEHNGISLDAIQTVTNSTDRGFVTTDLMGGPWQEERFDLVEESRVPTTNPFSWSGGNAEACATDEMSIGDNTQSPYSDEARAANTKIERHGYHEDCSEYLACQNESGDWVVEASRRKIIAQASDEVEAQRIAAALNLTAG